MKPPPNMLTMLLRCRTLSDAENELLTLGLTRAQSWGVWDGWSGREKTVGGLSAETKRNMVAEREYGDGYAMGAKFRRTLRSSAAAAV